MKDKLIRQLHHVADESRAHLRVVGPLLRHLKCCDLPQLWNRAILWQDQIDDVASLSPPLAGLLFVADSRGHGCEMAMLRQLLPETLEAG
eukprot:6117245-Prymnesium_polylepis.1